MADKRKRTADGSSSTKRKDVVNKNAKIKVKTPTGNTIVLKVKRSDTIGSIKIRIQDHEPIPFNQQELIFDGVGLRDMDTVANVSVKKKATFTLLRKATRFINIYINTLDGDITHYVKAQPAETIGSILHRIYCGEGCKLLFNDVVLDNSSTLADFNVVDGSILTHFCIQDQNMKVSVNTTITGNRKGKTVTLSVDPTWPISRLKSQIEKEEHIPCDEQVLIYNDKVLGDGGTLFDFNITRESTLTLMRRPKELEGLMKIKKFEGLMQIFIKTLTGEETVDMEVKPDDTIGDIKAKIKDRLDIPCDEMELVFNEMVMNNVHTLGGFQIKNGSTVTLMRVTCGFMRIFMKSDAGRYTITLSVRPSDTILDVKSKFYDKKRIISPIRQRLFFNGKQLEDSATLAHYHISEESTVYFDCAPFLVF